MNISTITTTTCGNTTMKLRGGKDSGHEIRDDKPTLTLQFQNLKGLHHYHML